MMSPDFLVPAAGILIAIVALFWGRHIARSHGLTDDDHR